MPLRRPAFLAGTVLALFSGLTAGCVEAPIIMSATITSSDSTGLLTITLEDSLPAYGWLAPSDSVTLRGAPEDLYSNNPQIVVPLRDGRTLVSDGQMVAAFDSTGNFFGVVMPRGRGPGEVTTLSGLWQSADDSVWMVDPSTRRISRFGPDLKYVRSVEYPRFGETSALSIFGGLNRDTTAVVEFNFSDAPGGPGIMRIEYRVGTWVMGGAAAIGEPRVFGIAQRFAPGVVPAGFSISPPFSPTAQWRPYGRCMIYGFPERWELSIESPDANGRFVPVTMIRAPLALGDAVTPERKEKHIVDAMARMPANNSEFPRDQYERALREPAFGRVLVSDDGAIWVQRYRESAERERDFWTIIDAHRLRAWRYELPTGSRLLAVRPQGALVATRNADDVETQAWVQFPKLRDIKVIPSCRFSP